jgi:tetratricopeptide (TPR) repeat protein
MKYALAILLFLFTSATFAAQEPVAPELLNALTDQQFEELMDQLVAHEEAQAALDGELISQASRSIRGVRKPAQSSAASLKQERNRILSAARSLAKSGQYDKASQLYFRMSRSPNFRDIAIESKYILGLTLFELGLHQASGFAFFDVISSRPKSGEEKYIRLALEKLSYVTDYTESDVLLKYAVSKVSPQSFPREQQDLFFYRLGDLKLKENKFEEAQNYLAKVPQSSPYYPNARYKLGLALARTNKTRAAFSAFSDLEAEYSNAPVTAPNRVDALMAKARVLYQAKNFDDAVELYRQIPRDTPQWHDSLFERSWAMLRVGQFRSALSNFQTLHSSYYQDSYIPESLLLRSIVYLYICKYDEMGKVLNLYDRIYKPIQQQVVETLRNQKNPEFYYAEVRKVFDYLQVKKGLDDVKRRVQVPYQVLRYVVGDGDISTSLRYLKRLEEELGRARSLSSEWQNSAVGKYSIGIVERRIKNTQTSIGRYVMKSMNQIRADLRRLSEQGDFLKLEQIGAEKESLRKEIAGKGLPSKQIDSGAARDYYIKNGYEYWPFQGEYWLDELGNYHYVGVQNCEV